MMWCVLARDRALAMISGPTLEGARGEGEAGSVWVRGEGVRARGRDVVRVGSGQRLGDDLGADLKGVKVRVRARARVRVRGEGEGVMGLWA